MEKMKTGIVIEGGGHRGIYAAGILDVLCENGIEADGVLGVSAGAVHGASYASHQIGRSVRYTMKYCGDKRYMSFRSWLKTGDLFNADFCWRELPEKLDPYDNDALESSPVAFYVTCTDVETGEPVYHRCKTLRGDEMKWLQASASMPLASNIVCADGRKMLDGGIADSIPLRAFERLGYTRNIVILTQPEGYRKGKNPLLPALRIAMRKYPALIRAMETRHIVYNEEVADIERRAEAGSVLLIRPKHTAGVGRTEKDGAKIKALYDIGRKDAIDRLDEIREFFGKR